MQCVVDGRGSKTGPTIWRGFTATVYLDTGLSDLIGPAAVHVLGVALVQVQVQLRLTVCPSCSPPGHLPT